MTKDLFSFVKSTGVWVVSLVMLIAIIGAVTACLKVENIVSGEVKTPKVEFSDYASFTNRVVNDLTNTDAIKDEQEYYQDKFFEIFPTILKNITEYANITNQGSINPDAFEEHLFNAIIKFDVDMRVSYLEQLAEESGNLLDYGEKVEGDTDKKIIEWIDFLDWFTNDFEDQLETNIEISESPYIQSSILTKVIVGGAIILVFMLFLMIMLFLQREKQQ